MNRKNKKLILIIIIVLVVIIGVGVPIYLAVFHNGLDKGKVMIRGHVINVEVANTPESRAKGLSDRDKLGSNDGMLFVMHEKRYHTFWMNGMKFPIDIIWIRDNKIIDLTKNVPIPTDPKDIPVYRPKTEVDKVLEVTAGYIDANNIAIGDEVGIDY
jgi:uncharacterized membrane protein (UPF0127 family)